MDNNFMDFVERANNASNFEAFWNIIVDEFSKYEVERIAYCALAGEKEFDIKCPSRSFIFETNYDQRYLDASGEDGFIDNDLTVELVSKNRMPVFWHDTDLWGEHATPAQVQQAIIDTEFDLDVGVTLPNSIFSLHDSGGLGLSMPSVSAEKFHSVWQEKQQKILRIAGVLDNGMRQAQLANKISLSVRQKEALEWFAAGLQAERVAEKMNISIKTLETHISAAKFKLGAKTRDHAIVRALVFKAITP